MPTTQPLLPSAHNIADVHVLYNAFRYTSMWLACSECCSMSVKPGKYTDTRNKGSMRSISDASDPSSATLGVTYTKYYHFGENWCSRYILSFLLKYIDFFGVTMCVEWKMVSFGRAFPVANYPLLPDLSFSPNSATRIYRVSIKSCTHFKM